jgi:hypothetical protein
MGQNKGQRKHVTLWYTAAYPESNAFDPPPPPNTGSAVWISILSRSFNPAQAEYVCVKIRHDSYFHISYPSFTMTLTSDIRMWEHPVYVYVK